MEEKYFPAKKDSELFTKIDLASHWIAKAKYLVAFTGAGISTESGLPDYRGPQ
jgi:NAD-dependent deacetylase